jgi:hypothetical protein
MAVLAGPDKMIATAPTTFDGTHAFSWVARGKLFATVVPISGFEKTYWVYLPNEAKRGHLLTGSISGVSSMVKVEVGAVALEHFIENDLTTLLITFLPFDRYQLLDARYVDQYAESLDQTNIPESYRGDRSGYSLLRKVFETPKVSIKGQTWTIECQVIASNGSIEKWSFSGTLAEFQITSWNRKLIVPPDAVRPLPVM